MDHLSNNKRKLSDDALMKKIAKGDKKAFNKLYNKYMNSVILKARQYMKDNNLAEDIAQEVWVKVSLNAHKYEGRSQFNSWLFTIVRNTSFVESKKNTKIRKNISFDNERIANTTSDQLNIENHMIQSSDINVIKLTISTLPSIQKNIISNWLNNDLEYNELAKQMNTTTSTVKSALFRAKRNLERSLKLSSVAI